jgi:hypothetical protein
VWEEFFFVITDQDYLSQHINQWPRKTRESTTALVTKKEKACVFTIYIIFNDKMQLINAAIIYDTACVTSQLFRKSFNCRYNPRMDYVFCLLTLKSYEKWWSPLFGATCNFNDQILPYGILFLKFINTNYVFYLLSFKFSR